jgi:hypothetical protein
VICGASTAVAPAASTADHLRKKEKTKEPKEEEEKEESELFNAIIDFLLERSKASLTRNPPSSSSQFFSPASSRALKAANKGSMNLPSPSITAMDHGERKTKANFAFF